MDQPGGEKPKLHIDEDWKSQVQAEKERLEKEKAAQAKPEAGTAAPSATAEQTAPPHQREFPPATLSVLITTLATQAMVLLGQIPNPLTGKAEIDLPQAKHFIDSLAMLDEKTAGNRTPDESRLLDNLLHELRMAYVHVATHVAGGGERE